MTPSVSRPFFRVLALCLVLAALSPAAHAQFMTNITLDKSTYLTYEPVEATVTITNRSGSDLVMGGPNGQAWLVFEVTDPAGGRVPPARVRTDETLVFKSGTQISRKVLVSNYHPFSEYGPYGIIANVYHPPSGQYYASNRARASFMEIKPFWEQNFGVPLGLPGAGQIRRYTLSLLRDTVRTYLYVRLLDDKTAMKLATFSLGTCITVMDPQVTVDSNNMLHVLFMTAPHIYAHAVINTQGRLEKKIELHKEQKTDRPQLVVQPDHSIAVRGGHVFDPSAPEGGVAKGRSIGDKPPGL